MKRRMAAWLALAATLGAGAGEKAKWARPDLVEKVAAGELQEAEASWWGYDREDATAFVQAALRSKARKVTLDRREGPWYVRPLFGRSDLTLVVPAGVELCAKRGEFRRQADFLLRFNCATNVTLTGGGTIRMWFEDYTNKALYGWSEWRHAVALLSCRNVRIENLRIADSGGDGIYLGQQGKIPANTDVTIRNVTLSRNNRQGISVITADRLLIEDCVMENTCGTPPMAGIDFEPNGVNEMLRDITVRNCVARGNFGAGFDFSVGNLNASSPEISITLENCRSEGNHQATKFHRAADTLTRFRGQVEFRNCVFNDLDGRRDTFRSKRGAETMGVRFVDCRAADPEKGGEVTPLGPEYGWKRLPPPTWADGTPLRAEATPVPTPDRVKIYDAAPRTMVALKPVHVRSVASYLVYADAPRTVHLKAWVSRVGRASFDGGEFTVYTPAKGVLARIPLKKEFRKEQEIAFTAPAAGFYRVRGRVVRSHALALTATDAPVALVNSPVSGLPGWSSLPGDVYLRIPEGCARFAVSAAGGGSSEMVRPRLTAPDGSCAWDRDNVSTTEIWFSPERPQAGVWRLSALKASKGCMDDYLFGVFGVPCLMFLSPDKTWVQ